MEKIFTSGLAFLFDGDHTISHYTFNPHQKKARFLTYDGDRYAWIRLFLKTICTKIIVTIHDPAESLRQAHYAQVGVDSHPREVFNQKDGLPE